MQINTGNSLSKLLLLVASIFTACNSATSVPKGIIAINPMKELMWDVAQVEAYATQHITRDSTKNIKTETLTLYQQVFALHKTSKDQFTQSIKYYEAHPEKQKILLDSLMQYATRQRDTALQRSFMKPVSTAK
ncbi:MAG: DUF4296 domain-containing protein [Hymenobacter sp.]|nr:MAG: DUF4296 domain-containing protein [Hymenobacter sp.]